MKRKKMPKVITFFLFLSLFLFSPYVVNGSKKIFGGGSGSADDPYIIEDVYDLQAIKDSPSNHYALANNINASGTKDWNHGLGFEPIGQFSGSLEGKGYKITSLFTKRTNVSYIGLFAQTTSGSRITNLTLVSVNFSGIGYVGGIVGSNNASIENCNVSGVIVGSSDLVGGIVGYNQGNILNTSYNSNITQGKITGKNNVGGITGYNGGLISRGKSEATVNGSKYVAGIAGWNSGWILDSITISNISGISEVGGIAGENYGLVTSSYSQGVVTGNTSVGGLVGSNSDSVEDSYSHVPVYGQDNVGGLIGANYGTVKTSYSVGIIKGMNYCGGLIGRRDQWGYSRAIDSFWDIDASKQTQSAGGEGLNTSDMMSISTYIRKWDLEYIWSIIDGKTYPFLRWQDRNNPIADAGPDLIAEAGFSTILNGSLCIDDMGIVNYTWTIKGPSGHGIIFGKRASYVFSELGIHEVDLVVSDSVGKSDTDSLNISVVDTTWPIAEAGNDLKIDEDEWAFFDGSGSTDNHRIANYTWSYMDPKEKVIFYGETARQPFLNPGTYNVYLNVTDNVGLWNTDFLIVTVKDLYDPVANAGPDMIVNEDTPVQFDGSGSYDDGGIFNYTWSYRSKTASIRFYGEKPVTIIEDPGYYVVTLRICDHDFHWDTDNANITVNDITPPVANAGPDITIDQNEIMSFDGRASSDNDVISEYRWTFNDGEYRVLIGQSPSYMFLLPGTYEILLIVKDKAGNSGNDTMVVTVRDNIPPIADAGPNIIANISELCIFDGRGSYDNIGIVSSSWQIGSLEVELDGLLASFKFSRPGKFTVTLWVIDASGLRGEDELIVNIVDNIPPVAKAGEDLNIDQGDTIHLDGSQSSDEIGIQIVLWTFHYSGKNITLEGFIVEYLFIISGIYKITLIVFDEGYNAGRDDLIVTVKDTEDPIARAGKDRTIRIGESVSINASLSSDNTIIIDYTWTIEGKEINGQELNYKFNKAGKYKVNLTVTDSNGNEGYDEIAITVKQNMLVPVLILIAFTSIFFSIGIFTFINIRKEMYLYQRSRLLRKVFK